MISAKFGWNWPSGSGEKAKNVKSLRQQQRHQRRTTDDQNDQKSSPEPMAKNLIFKP